MFKKHPLEEESLLTRFYSLLSALEIILPSGNKIIIYYSLNDRISLKRNFIRREQFDYIYHTPYPLLNTITDEFKNKKSTLIIKNISP